MASFIKIYPENPNPKAIQQVVDCLLSGGIVIYPTDTVYGIGCDIFQHKAIERVAQIKGIKAEKANFSFICSDLSHISDYTRQLSTPIYKLLKRTLPGPFTYILNANNNVPNILQSKKKTVGIRIPDNPIIVEIVRTLSHPILTTSIRDVDDVIEYSTDPELIYEKYKDIVDIVVDGGFGGNIASTVVDCTGDDAVIIRQGKGHIDEFL